MEEIAFNYCTSGKAAVQIIVFTWCQGNGKVLPLNKVFGAGVSPMHGTPVWTIGVVLVENMIVPAIMHQAVRVIHPVDLGHEMIVEAMGIRHRWLCLPNASVCFLQQESVRRGALCV
jgi:hypothetical protein